jgi:hypothetical protein
MANNPVPTVTSKGWVTDAAGKADLLLSYAFTSQYSQTSLYPGQVTSLQFMVQQWGNSPMQIQNLMSQAFEIYFTRYYDRALVAITVIDPTSLVDGRLTVQLNAEVTQDGVTYSVGRLVSFLNSTIVRIMNLNNGTSVAFNA